MADRQKYVVLSVIEPPEDKHVMATYGPQVAMVHEYDFEEDAATFNVGSHPDQEKRGKPYRVIVVPWEHWKEYEVYSESEKGRSHLRAYPSENLTIRAHDPAEVW